MNQLRDRFINFLNSRPYLTAAVACFICSLMVLAQPGYRAIKKIRSSNLLEESKRLVDEESYIQAFYKARTSVMLNGGNIKAGRQLADLALKFNHPQAHRFWETVIRNEKATASDWAFAVDAAFQKLDYSTAFDYLLRWEDQGIENPADFEFRRAQAYALSGQLEVAKERATGATQKYPNNKDIYRLNLYLENMLFTTQERNDLAKSLIETEAAPLYDLKWVAANNLVETAIRIDAIEQLLLRTDLDLDQRLSTINLGAKLGWDEASKRIDLIGTSIDLTDTQSLATYTSALCLLGRYTEVLQLIDGEFANESRILLRNLLLAQVKIGGIEETLERTSQHRSNRLTTLAEETLLRALAFQESGNQRLYENNLDQAIDSAEFEDLAFLEYQFKQLGETDALLDLYERVSEHPTFGTQARAYWLNLAISARSESEIAFAINSDPNWLNELFDPHLKANAIYYSLLYATDPSIARHQAEQLASRFRGTPAFQLLAAFAYYQAGLKEVASQFATGAHKRIEALDPRSRFIASVVTQTPFAIPNHTLLPVEQALLQ